MRAKEYLVLLFAMSHMIGLHKYLLFQGTGIELKYYPQFHLMQVIQ